MDWANFSMKIPLNFARVLTEVFMVDWASALANSKIKNDMDKKRFFKLSAVKIMRFYTSRESANLMADFDCFWFSSYPITSIFEKSCFGQTVLSSLRYWAKVIEHAITSGSRLTMIYSSNPTFGYSTSDQYISNVVCTEFCYVLVRMCWPPSVCVSINFFVIVQRLRFMSWV